MGNLSNEQLATAKAILAEIHTHNAAEKEIYIVDAERVEFFSKLENAKAQAKRHEAAIYRLEVGAEEATEVVEEVAPVAVEPVAPVAAEPVAPVAAEPVAPVVAEPVASEVAGTIVSKNSKPKK